MSDAALLESDAGSRGVLFVSHAARALQYWVGAGPTWVVSWLLCGCGCLELPLCGAHPTAVSCCSRGSSARGSPGQSGSRTCPVSALLPVSWTFRLWSSGLRTVPAALCLGSREPAAIWCRPGWR